MSQDQQSSAVETREEALCAHVTKNGGLCKNKQMRGYRYCSRHQPTCAYTGPNGQKCRNFVVDESTACIFHTSNTRAKETDTQQVSLMSFVRNKDISRRAFLTFTWTAKYAKMVADSIAFLPRPLQIVGGFIGVGVAEYLLQDFLTYFKEQHGIEYLLPLKLTDRPQVAIDGQDVQIQGIAPRVINRGRVPSTVVLEFVDYHTGQAYASPQIKLNPNQSYVDTTTVASVSGFWGGLTVSSDQQIEARNVVGLTLVDTVLDIRHGQSVRFRSPQSPDTAGLLDIQNIIAIIAFGNGQQLQHVQDIACTVRGDEIYFDREAILDALARLQATEAMMVLQVEGRLIVDQRTHDLARQHLQGYDAAVAETRFETTAQIIKVEL